ncbi:MAG: YebC/PmpR family DNA-binding transcriptional regulator [Gammaproteobacteria bacterium]|nr:YebC/PmpR family DNA-binding transcriptional regulator [Gammaproteobacteria bacterium]
MAGHSKWANIRFRKATQDAKRGKLFTRLIREITVAARAGGGDAEANPRLRTAVDKALNANMTKDNIERAIKRGTGELEGVSYEEVRYEGYAPGGIAVLVECTTDNRNRTVSEVRHAFSKYGGNLGTDGSVAYLFNTVGVITCAAGTDEDQVMEVAANAGAEDIQVLDDGAIDVTTPPEAFHSVQQAIKDAGIGVAEADLMQRPTTEVSVDEEHGAKVLRLLDALEELDDVQNVFSNVDFPDSLLLEAG